MKREGEKERGREMRERIKKVAKEGRRLRREERRALKGWRRWWREGADAWFWGFY